jgi:hypothetical protein
MRQLLAALMITALSAALCGSAWAQAGPAQVELESPVVLEGENVAGFVSNVLAGQQVGLNWVDPFGDVFYSTVLAPGATGPAGFAFRAVGAPFPITRIEAQGVRLRSSMSLTVMPREDAARYAFFAAVDAVGEASPARAMALRRAGITAAVVEGYQGAFAAGDAGLRPLVWGLTSAGMLSLDEKAFREAGNRYETAGDAAALVREPSLSNEEEFTRLLTEVSRQAERVRTLAPAALIVAAGASTGWKTEPLDLSFAEEDLAAFGRYLAARAPDLAPSARPGVQQARTMPLTAREMKARILAAPEAPVSLAAWALHREFMDVTLAQTISDLARAAVSSAKQPGPSAVNWSLYRPVTGVSGAQAPAAYGGYDWTLFARDLDLAILSREAPEWSWALARDVFSGGRTAVAIDAKSARAGALVWRAMCEGLAGIALENAADVVPPQAAARERSVAGGQAAPAQHDELHSALDAAQTGVADLVANLRKDATAVIIYSPKSVRAGWMLEYLASEGLADAPADAGTRGCAAWSRILDDLGIDYRWLAIEDVAAGALERLLPRVVVLPEVWCVSPEAAQALVEYANAGGLVIADTAAALLDGDYAAYRRPQLDALLGARQPALIGGRAALVAAGPRALEGQPAAPALSVAIPPVVQSGRGGALYLNRSVAGYAGPSDKASGDLLASLERVLADAGIVPKAIIYLDGKPVHAAVTSFASDRTQVLFIRPAEGALPEGEGSTVEVRLRDEGAAYNLLSAAPAGQSLGAAGRFEIEVTGRAPIVLSRTTAPLTGILFEPTVGEGAFFVNVQLQAEAPLGDRLVKVEFYAPDGLRAAQFDQIALARGGAWLGTVLMPANAPRGVWRVVCRDIETGMTAWRDIEAR